MGSKHQEVHTPTYWNFSVWMSFGKPGFQQNLSRMTYRLDISEVLPPLLHLLTLRPSAVVQVDDPLAHVRAVTDHFIGHLVVQAMGDCCPVE